jgi:surface antigen
MGRVIAALALLLMAWAPPAAANFGFWLRGVDLSAADMEAVKGAIGGALEGEEGAVVPFENAESGITGTATLMRRFQTEGAPCGDVAILFVRDGRQAPFRLNFCRTPAGQWAIAP